MISVTSYPGIFENNQNSGLVQEFLVPETIAFFFCIKPFTIFQFTLEDQFLIFICYLEVFHFGVEKTLINSRSRLQKHFYTHMICYLSGSLRTRLLAGTNFKWRRKTLFPWSVCLIMYFSNSLIIHQVKTKEIMTVTVVWIPGLN